MKVLVSAHLVLNFLRLLKLGGENPAHSEMDSWLVNLNLCSSMVFELSSVPWSERYENAYSPYCYPYISYGTSEKNVF